MEKKMAPVMRQPWQKPVLFRDLKIGEYYVPDNCRHVYQKTQKPGWQSMATRVSTGEVSYVSDARPVTRMSPHQVETGENNMSKISFVTATCPPPPTTLQFHQLDVGETFRLANGCKVMIKTQGCGNSNAVYLHSGDKKTIDSWAGVVRRKIVVNDHGDE